MSIMSQYHPHERLGSGVNDRNDVSTAPVVPWWTVKISALPIVSVCEA